jgi:hypothetical protein
MVVSTTNGTDATRHELPCGLLRMWIPDRVFFGNLAFIVGVAAGVVLLASHPSCWRRWAEFVVAPALAVGGFIGLTATRGMPLRLWERVGLALWVALLVGAWLVGAAVTVRAVRRHGGSRAGQVVAGWLAALVLARVTRALLRG